MGVLSFKDFEVNKVFDFGYTVLSEDEIIEFAKTYDPLDFHIDREAALKSPFKGLIASGPHLFNLNYKKNWVPLFKDTVICGLEVTQWKFIKPVYANQKTFSTVTIEAIAPNSEKRHAAVTWLFEFKTEKGELVQSLKMVVLHKMD